MRTLFFLLLLLAVSSTSSGQRQREKLDRGVVALRYETDKVFISWRMLAEDQEGIAFNVYRQTGPGKRVRINRLPLTAGTFYIDSLADLSKSNSWYVCAVVKGREEEQSKPFLLGANSAVKPYLSIPLKTPDGYTANDASPGDLDGDGMYELIVHMTGKAHDNSHRGFTDPPILHAYKMDGTFLWSINLGKNIREGAHYTQFIVYDLDGDRRAEIACKTADGTTDGHGKVIGDPDANYVNEGGYILQGPEYLTIFDGLSGRELVTTNYIPARHPDTLNPTSDELKAIWGDGYGNRMDRFLACVAYLDGERPSLVMTRGYYTRSVLSAWNFRNGKLTPVWTFDSDANDINRPYRGQGYHSLSVGDVDTDGKDEVIFGACVIDDNGKGLYSTGLGHGDAIHYSDLDPDKPGWEVFGIQERFDDAGAHFRNAASGEVYWKKPSVKAGDDGEGPGRGNAFDIDPRHRGSECWVKGAGIRGLFNAKGVMITDKEPAFCNFAVWWDGDLLRELLDKNVISKWDWNAYTLKPLLTADGCTSNNGTKATPALSADLFGDWREEVVWRTTDNKELRIYMSTIPTPHRFTTLMHDPVYRLGVAWQNVAYNQPPHVSFYLGEGMEKPPGQPAGK
jgi:rhamnogalacturonan endolyase